MCARSYSIRPWRTFRKCCLSWDLVWILADWFSSRNLSTRDYVRLLPFLVDAHCWEKRSPLLSWSTMIRLLRVSVSAEIVEYKFQQLGFGVVLLLPGTAAVTWPLIGYGVAVAKLWDSIIILFDMLSVGETGEILSCCLCEGCDSVRIEWRFYVLWGLDYWWGGTGNLA